MVEETENKSKTSIWWDIENCHVPKDVDPHYIAQNMTSALQHANLTGPIDIQAFGDTNILPHVTQKALSDTGITLNHVPRGNKDAADKAILVGMLLWALDNPPPANILLISGDGDFANALHRLRLKTYSILLAVPAQFVKPALTGAAKKLWFWKDMAKGQLAEPELSQHSSNPPSHELGASCAMDMLPKMQTSSSLSTLVTQSAPISNGYASPKKRMSTSEHFRSLSLDNQSRVMSGESRTMSSGLENLHTVVSDRKVFPGSGNSSPSANNSNRHVTPRPPFQAARSMDFGQFPHFLPQSAGNHDSVTATPFFNSTCGSKPPNTQVGPLPRGPLKNIAPNNNRGVNSLRYARNIAPDNIYNHNVPFPQNEAMEHRNRNAVSAPLKPTVTNTPPSSVMANNLDKLPHDVCVGKLYCAMKTLEKDMLAPTESNLSDCIQYWDPQYEKVDLKLTLKTAAEARQSTRTQLGAGLILYFPPDHTVPWQCVDPGNMSLNHSSDVWLELQRFLVNGEKKQAFLTSSNRYHAAMILKNSCGTYMQNLIVGKILNLLQQAMQEKRWLRRMGPVWAPLVLNQKTISDWSGGEGETQLPAAFQGGPVGIWKLAPPANVGRAADKEFVLNKLRSFLSQTLENGTVCNLSLLSRDFELATGTSLDYQKLGYANLQELIKGLSDVVYVETTDLGVSLVRLVKVNGSSTAHCDNNRADKENEEKADKRLGLVQELKSWLSYSLSNMKDGYDVSRIHQDFLQATGKDLSKEGLDFYKLNDVLTQLQDVISIKKSPVGQWLAFPVDGAKDAGKKGLMTQVS